MYIYLVCMLGKNKKQVLKGVYVEFWYFVLIFKIVFYN